MITIRRNFWVIVVLLVASIIAASIWGQPVYYRLIYLWGLLLVSSYVWTYYSLRGIRVKRVARTARQQVGQVFEERVVVMNTSRLPHLWVGLHDQSNLPGVSSSRVLTWIGGGQERSYISYTWLTRRGLFSLGPTRLTSGDLFGLFSAEAIVQTQGALLVTPYFVDLQSFPSPSGVLPGGRALHQRTHEVTPYAAGVREYYPGDSLNRIHWPTTARRNQLMVKEFDQDPQADVWIFVDAQKFVQAANPEADPIIKTDRLLLWRHKPEEVRLPSATIEYSVSAAASIAGYFIYRGHAVGLAAAGNVHTILPAERGERQLGKILENLAFIDGEGELPLEALTTAQASYLPRGSTVVIITPSVQESVLLTVDDLAKRGMHPVVVLIDAASFDGARGSVALSAQLTARNIPALTVANRHDLRASLEVHGVHSLDKAVWWAMAE